MESYNLTEQPWIYGIANHKTEKYNLVSVLQNAHHIEGIQPPTFRNRQFPWYEYLIIRLLTGIVSDAYRNEPQFKTRLLQQGLFDDTLFQYLNEFGDRFDLFDDEHPFFQMSDTDASVLNKKITPDSANVLQINPLTPAPSGRLLDAKISPGDYLGNAVTQEYVNPLKSLPITDKKEFQKTIEHIYRISYEEYAYLLLYNNGMVPGSGQGYKSGLLGNLYYTVVVNGKNLFETILLNAFSIKNDLDDTICNIPLWRWDSIWDGYIYEFDRTGKKARQTMHGQSVIGGLFFPCRLIQAKPDNGYIKDLKFQALYVPGITDIGYAKENSILDDYREAWVTIEPHATYKQVTENDVEKPKYHDINIGEASWLTIMQCLTMGMADEVNPSAAKQTKEELEKAKAVKKAKAKAKKQTNEYEYPPSNLADNPILNKFTELTITVFYRTVASKKAKVLMEAGKIQKRIPEKILEDNECKRIVKMCADSIKRGIWKLNQIQPLYVRNKPFDDDTKKTADLFGLAIQFSQTCEHMMFRPGGYIQQIAYADDKSAVYQKFLEEEVQTARNIWGKMRDTSRIVKHVEYESWLCGYIIADTWQRKGDENDKTGNTGFNPDISVNE